jgi:carboxyl-terminal processing protease
MRRESKVGVRAWVALLCTAGVALVSGCASRAPKPMPLTVEQKTAYVESFDKVWTTVKDRHWDPTLGGVDWDAAKAELRPKVEAASSADEARGVMNELIARLKLSHYGIIPASSYAGLQEEQGTAPKGEGETGISVRVVGEQALAWRVRPGSTAAEAGIKPGYVIEQVAGRPISKALNAVREAMKDSGSLDVSMAMLVESRLRGEPGEKIALTVLDEKDQRRTVEVALGEPVGQRAVLGNLPPIRVTFDSKKIPVSSVPGASGSGDVGYFTFSLFFDPPWLMPQVNAAMESFTESRGVIVDMRGNHGGMIALGAGVGGWFVTQPDQKLGTMVMRDMKLNMVLNPRVNSFTGPVAVLVDGSSVSCAEILSGGLQDLKRAKVFGLRSAGACLPSTVEKLPSGDGFQYAFADYISVGGQTLEGRGVTPDVVVPYDRAAMLRGEDPVLNAAVRWISEQSRESKSGS